jgi:hypothetical protein
LKFSTVRSPFSLASPLLRIAPRLAAPIAPVAGINPRKFKIQIIKLIFFNQLLIITLVVFYPPVSKRWFGLSVIKGVCFRLLLRWFIRKNEPAAGFTVYPYTCCSGSRFALYQQTKEGFHSFSRSYRWLNVDKH